MRVTGKRIDTGDPITLTAAGGRIDLIEPGIDATAVGGADVWISPGFCDIQINGYAGRDFNIAVWGQQGAIESTLYDLRGILAAAGTALFCPTITTNSDAAITESIGAIRRALDADPALARSVPGIHVEGPYIASEDGPRGAHPLEYVCDPDWEQFQRWQEAAGGWIRLFTLAPERAGALPFITRLRESGVVPAIGHTAAPPGCIADAVNAGALLSTHVGNGAHSVLPRHPNYIWEQLAADTLSASIIADGHHLPPSVAKCIARVKGPERLILVSDAVSLGGRPRGLYADGRYEVHASGKITLAGTPYLAGAGHLLDTCVANAVRFTDLTLHQAAGCASAVPARLLDLQAHKGSLGVGSDADLTLFRMPTDGPLQIVATVCAGVQLY